jgi:hypothetical protein
VVLSFLMVVHKATEIRTFLQYERILNDIFPAISFSFDIRVTFSTRHFIMTEIGFTFFSGFYVHFANYFQPNLTHLIVNDFKTTDL